MTNGNDRKSGARVESTLVTRQAICDRDLLFVRRAALMVASCEGRAMTIYERAVELVPDGATIGLGSGRAAEAFVRLIGERVRAGKLHVRGLPTSEVTAELARREGIPLVTPAEVTTLDLDVDGADEVDPHLDLIKGYGRRFVRERVVAALAKRFVILAGEEKLVPTLGSRGKLPVEVVPFALPLCEGRLRDLQCPPTLYRENGQPCLT